MNVHESNEFNSCVMKAGKVKKIRF